MIAYQLTVPVENAPGKLARVTAVLNREKINIRAITISSFGDKGFFNILVDDPRGAQKALLKENLTVELNEVIAVLIDDRPGGLDRVVQFLAESAINIENAYGFVLESHKNAVFVIQVDDIEKAVNLLTEKKFKTLNAEALATIEPFHYMKY
ncbi:MAG TPA: ACT domain-containing protein [Spirochaetota bacterium]|nr:ACT domain-containing protein [Spirochaetota bacterium]HPR49314.1 ACT domain-containing protein [Spirochaetota bacterium]